MSRGKTAVWHIINPETGEHFPCALLKNQIHDLWPSSIASALDNMPPALIERFELDRLPVDSNTKYRVQYQIGRCDILPIQALHRNEIGILIIKKATRALILTAHCYAKICKGNVG